MLLLSSRKSGLNDPDMVRSQMHSFMAHSNCEKEREDNNNTVIAEKEVLRTPTTKCRFHDGKPKSCLTKSEERANNLWSNVESFFWFNIFQLQQSLEVYFLLIERLVLIKIEYFMRTQTTNWFQRNFRSYDWYFQSGAMKLNAIEKCFRYSCESRRNIRRRKGLFSRRTFSVEIQDYFENHFCVRGNLFVISIETCLRLHVSGRKLM